MTESNSMTIYAAPMEGITLHPFRLIHNQFFPGCIDEYYTPFLVANQTKTFKNKEIRDVLPENNRGLRVVPQLLANDAEEFVSAVEKLIGYGYRKLNLNLGCPMRTVVTKGKGSGFLALPDRLDAFFDQSFQLLEPWRERIGLEISVKTRTGLKNHEEAVRLLQIYNRYPISEVIIHPRLQTDFYENTPNMDVFAMMYEGSVHPVCYNGDIVTISDYKALCGRFPGLERVMLGRGLLRNPSLIRQIRGGKPMELEELKVYHDAIVQEYRKIMSDQTQVVAKMKEIWWYMCWLFPDSEKAMKKIRKSHYMDQYLQAADEMFACPMRATDR